MFEASLKNGVLILSGDMNRTDIKALDRQLPGLLPPRAACGDALVIDCDALEIDDGMAMAALVRLLKIAVRQGGVYHLRGAGQMLAHNIYRAHLMDNGITLLETRMNEPSA
jgi:ABC-type transporter Mla MlaB component